MIRYIKLILFFCILIIGLSIDSPVEFKNKLFQIIFEHLIILVAFILLFFNFRIGRKFKRPLNWISHIINSILVLIIGIHFVWIILLDFSGYYPIWTDSKIYINQVDKSQIIVGQKNRISGSIIYWRIKKVKNILPGIRLISSAKTDTLNGTWRLITKEDEFNSKGDTIINYKNGKEITTNR